MNKRWALAAMGAGAGALAALVYALRAPTGVNSPTSAHKPQLAEDTPRVAAWIDARLLSAAAARASVKPDTEESLKNQDTGDEPGLVPSTATLERDSDAEERAIRQQREQLYRALDAELGLDPKTIDVIAGVLEQSPYAGTGNPKCTVHPMSVEQCRAQRGSAKPESADAVLCGAPNMVAVFNPKTEDVNRAKICMDQYEFPNIPCEYPLVWVRASEAAAICKAQGKRICDAHEWEGACAGALLPAAQEYFFQFHRDESSLTHNNHRARSWLGSLTPLLDVCATIGSKSPDCWDVTWEACGSNTYPAGSFLGCVSPFGVYDLLGNVAEHMNLPLTPNQLASRGGIGETEMKGSWFAHDGLAPHPDDCRWRAPAWHETTVDSPNSHRNYQLGFRCCKDI